MPVPDAPNSVCRRLQALATSSSRSHSSDNSDVNSAAATAAEDVAQRAPVSPIRGADAAQPSPRRSPRIVRQRLLFSALGQTASGDGPAPVLSAGQRSAFAQGACQLPHIVNVNPFSPLRPRAMDALRAAAAAAIRPPTGSRCPLATATCDVAAEAGSMHGAADPHKRHRATAEAVPEADVDYGDGRTSPKRLKRADSISQMMAMEFAQARSRPHHGRGHGHGHGHGQSRYEAEFAQLRRLGQGEFGEVFKCYNRLDGIVYAIKRSRRPINGEKDECVACRPRRCTAARTLRRPVGPGLTVICAVRCADRTCCGRCTRTPCWAPIRTSYDTSRRGRMAGICSFKTSTVIVGVCSRRSRVR